MNGRSSDLHKVSDDWRYLELCLFMMNIRIDRCNMYLVCIVETQFILQVR